MNPVERDLRVDLLKGLALCMVFVDHIEALAGVRVVSGWTLQALGPSDAAELFVLLTGLVVGRSYSRRLEQSSLVATQWHALRRAWRIYAVFVAAGLAAVFMVKLAPSDVFERPSFDLLRQATFTASATSILSLRLIPFGFHFFPLYIVFLLFAPGVVLIMRRSVLAGLVPAVILYATVQAFRAEPAVAWFADQRMWVFNPFAWQLAFVIGLAGGVMWSKPAECEADENAVRSAGPGLRFALVRPSWTWFVWTSCLIVLILGWFLKHSPHTIVGEPASHVSREFVTHLSDKPNLGLFRLLHGLAVMSCLLLLISNSARLLVIPLAKPLITCGQHSLLVYTCGLLLTYANVIVLHWHGADRLLVAFLEIDSLAILCVVAWLAGRGKAKIRPRPAALH
jgi:hypothetical protein